MHHSEQQILPLVGGRDSRNILDATNNTIFLKISNSLSKNKRERKIFFGFKKLSYISKSQLVLFKNNLFLWLKGRSLGVAHHPLALDPSEKHSSTREVRRKTLFCGYQRKLKYSKIIWGEDYYL